MRIQESLVTDKQIALELFLENGKYRLPIEGKDYYFPTLEKVHEAFLNQDTYDTIKLTQNGKKSYLHLFMDEIEVFDTKKALRQRLSQDSQGVWAEIRNGKEYYFVEERGWRSTSYKKITEQQCLERLTHTTTMTKVLGIGLGMLALLPGAVEFARHLPIGSKEAAMGLIALNQKSPVLGAVGYSLLPKQVQAQAMGTEFQVNTYTTSDQSYPCVAPLNDGGFVVTWVSNGQDGDSNGIYGQRYDSNGVAAGAEFQVNTYTTSSQHESCVAPLNNGGFVVTWTSNGQDGSGSNGIYAQRFDSSGLTAGIEFQVNTYTTGSQDIPSVAPLNDGGFVITWHSRDQDGDSNGIYGQRYDANGNIAGAEFQVNSYTTGNQARPSVAPLNDGGFVVTWTSNGQDGDLYGIYGQRYDANGNTAGAEFQANTYTTSSQLYPSIAPLSDGGFVVTWYSDGQDGDLDGIYAQRYDSSGVAAGTEFQVNTYTTNDQNDPSISLLLDGGFVVVWQSRGQDGNGSGIYGQRYDSSGAVAGTEFQVNTYTTSLQTNPSIAALNDGGFVVTWESGSIFLTWSWSSITTFEVGQDGDLCGIFGQRYDASGDPIPLQLPTSTIVTPTPSATQLSTSQKTPTPTFQTTQSAFSSPTAPPSNTPSPTRVTSPSMLGASTVVTSSPSQTPKGAITSSSNAPSSTPTPTASRIGPTVGSSSNTIANLSTQAVLTRSIPAPNNTPLPTSATTRSMFGSLTETLPPTTIRLSNMPSPTSAKTGNMFGSTTVSSPLPDSTLPPTFSTQSSLAAPSTSRASDPISSNSAIFSVEQIVYGESYSILVNDQVVGSYTVSGGTGLLDSGNPNVIYFDFDPSFEPEEGQIITLFYVPEEEVALWESIEIEGESYECLEARGQVTTNQGRSSYQMVFEDTECLAVAPMMLATALPLTLNY